MVIKITVDMHKTGETDASGLEGGKQLLRIRIDDRRRDIPVASSAPLSGLARRRLLEKVLDCNPMSAAGVAMKMDASVDGCVSDAVHR
eukprot:2907247-Rhodomonas_salina.2